jgi:hypothetical protein
LASKSLKVFSIKVGNQISLYINVGCNSKLKDLVFLLANCNAGRTTKNLLCKVILVLWVVPCKAYSYTVMSILYFSSTLYMFCALTGEAKGSIANEGKPIVALEIKNPVISIYDTATLKKKKVLSSSEAGAHEYVSRKLIFFLPPPSLFQTNVIKMCRYNCVSISMFEDIFTKVEGPKLGNSRI